MITLVEDDALVATSVAYLTRSGFAVVTARRTRVAVSRTPLLVLDLGLPHGDGLDSAGRTAGGRERSPLTSGPRYPQ